MARINHGYLAAPGCCISCGSSDSTKKVVDWERKDPARFDRFHRIYTCEVCLVGIMDQLAPLIGMALVKAGDVADQAAMIAQLEVELAEARARAARAEGVIGDMHAIATRAPS